MIFVFIGMPGSGKGTQAAELVKKLGVSHISLGEILRFHATNNTEIGSKIKNLIGKGLLINDDLVNNIIADEINNCKTKKIILDGYPRTLDQLNFLKTHFLDEKIILVYFRVERDKLINRLLNRMICSDCNKTFSEFDLEKMNYICDGCDSKNLSRRNDDDKETILKRMEVFDNQTYPIIEYIRNNQTPFLSLIEINGDDSIDNINKILYDTIKTH